MVEFTALIVVKSFSVEPMESVAETVAFVRAIIGKTGTAEPELPLVRELRDTLEFTATNVGFVAVEPVVRAEPSWIDRDVAEMVPDWALRIYMGAVLKRHKPVPPVTTAGEGNWIDLMGLLMPQSAEDKIIDDIISGRLDSIEAVNAHFKDLRANYNELRWSWSYRIILDYYGIDELTEEAVERIHQDYVTARREWIALIREDAENEFTLGDIDRDVLDDFVTLLDREVDFENQKLYM